MNDLWSMVKNGWWGESPFADRRMLVAPAHPDNYYSGGGQFPQRDCNPIAFVWHEPQEPSDDYESTPVWFSRYHPDQPGTTTYYNDSDGDVYQCVPTNRAPVANGLKGKPVPVFGDGGPEFGSYSLNQQTHSSEVEGYTGTIAQTMTQAQYAGCVDSAALFLIMYDLPRNPKRVGIAHGHLATDRTDGIWIAEKSGIPQEAVNKVLKMEKDIQDLRAVVLKLAVDQNKNNDQQGALIVSHALRLNALEAK